MTALSITPVEHPAAWTNESLLAQTDQWVYRLTEEDIAELDQALQDTQAKGLVMPHIGKADFAIPQLMARLAPFQQQLEKGLGLLQIKGLPVERYTKDQASTIYWGLGMQLGKPWAQNKRGHLMGDVLNVGKDFNDPSARGYQTSIALNMHTDGADIVGLLFLKQAPEGGESTITSALSVYNLLARTQPEMLQHLLSTEFCTDWRDEEAPGELPYRRGSVFSQGAAGITCFILSVYIESAQRHASAPRLTEKDRAALAAFEAATVDPALLVKFKQEPGDIFLLNNHFHLHGRSSFVDADEPQERRHLRRLWIESEAWDGIRPRTMQETLVTSRTWESSDNPVQMWDSLAAH